MKEKPVHLHWIWQKPHLLVGVQSGVSLCGLRGVSKHELTAVPKYTTCPRCKIVYNRKEAADADDR